MKKVLLFVGVVGLLFSCSKEEARDYATLSGKIENATVKELIINGKSGYSKKISINEDGIFSDTLNLKKTGELFMFMANGRSQVFLKNGDDIKVTVDANNFNKTLKYSGKGSETSSYIAEKLLMQSKIPIQNYFKLDKANFDKKINELTNKFTELIKKHNKIDTAFASEEKKSLEKLPEMLSKQYAQMNAKNTQIASLDGKPSPEFNNYENYKGGTTSLKDLRGKYVYIDVWATWCRPCIGEIPHLQKLEREFHNKNIEFVSISVDKESAKGKWKKMIADKKMSGVQLFATQGDSFSKDFNINSIPRFILLDPKGNVVKSNAPRPSSPDIKKVLNNLLK